MHGRHITRHGDSYYFQIRWPRLLDPDFKLAPVRVKLGRVNKRDAQYLARILALAMATLLTRVRKDGVMDYKTDTGRAVARSEFMKEFAKFIPALALLDVAGECDPVVPDFAPVMFDAALNGMLDLIKDRNSGNSALATRQGAALERYYFQVAQDEDLARTHLGLKPLNKERSGDKLAEIAVRVESLSTHLATENERLRTQIAEAEKSENLGPLFSVAADAYIERLRNANGDTYDELKYLRHRKAVFLQLLPDKPVSQYTGDDLQHFVNRIRYLAPNFSKSPNYKVENVIKNIEENERLGRSGLALGTIVDNYLGRIKTIIKQACSKAHIPYLLADVRIIFPKNIRKPAARLAPDYQVLGQVFAEGIKSGLLADAMLPLLGFVTGRRLGLLAFLTGEDIVRYHDVWIVRPRQIIEQGGKYMVTPHKTDESLRYFVLHDLFEKIGFVDWARGQKGFLFQSLLKAVDPADAASKRMSRLFKNAGVDTNIFKTFHGTRHAKINQDREMKLASRTTRLQVGHELDGIHDSYGDPTLRRSELHEIAHVELPEEIDWTVFHGLDFDALANGVPRGGHRKRSNRKLTQAT